MTRTITITIECCEGVEQHHWDCERDRCPLYQKAKQAVSGNWSYTGTGFGNLYGNPTHETYLGIVRQIVISEEVRKQREGKK